MSFTVYILWSTTIGKYYVGHTEKLSDRLFRHNNSGSNYTSQTKDWELVYTEIFETRSEASRREKEIKNKKSKKFIENLVDKARASR